MQFIVRVVKFVALSFALGCVVAFVTSIRYSFGLGIGRANVGVSGGRIVMDVRPVPIAAWPLVKPAFALCLIVAVLAHRCCPPAKLGTYRGRRYDLAGNVTGVPNGA